MTYISLCTTKGQSSVQDSLPVKQVPHDHDALFIARERQLRAKVGKANGRHAHFGAFYRLQKLKAMATPISLQGEDDH